MTQDPGASGTTQTQAQPEAPAGPRPVTWAPVPKVNLLPIEIVEGRAFRRTQIVLAGAVVLVIGVIGVGTVLAENQVGDAQTDYDAAQAQVNRLQQQQTEYAEVPKIFAQVEAATAARKQVYVGDAPWYRYIRELDRALPAGVEFSTISMTLSTTSTAPSGPLAPAAAAALTVSGTAPDYKLVAEWMEAFDQVRGLQSVTLLSAARQGLGVTSFSATGVAGSGALSGRYQKTEDEATASAGQADSADQNGDRSNAHARTSRR